MGIGKLMKIILKYGVLVSLCILLYSQKENNLLLAVSGICFFAAILLLIFE